MNNIMDDRQRWNQRYLHEDYPREPANLVSQWVPALAHSADARALDIAAGMGRHSRLLAERGYQVDAVELSDIAIETLRTIPDVHPQQIDLQTHPLPPGPYDLILNCNFYLPQALDAISDRLRIGGLLIFQSFAKGPHSGPSMRPENLVDPARLRQMLSLNMDILHAQQREISRHRGGRAQQYSLVARKRTPHA